MAITEKNTSNKKNNGFNIETFFDVGPFKVAKGQGLLDSSFSDNLGVNITDFFNKSLTLTALKNKVVAIIYGDKTVFSIERSASSKKYFPISNIDSKKLRQEKILKIPTQLRDIVLETQRSFVADVRSQLLLDKPNFPKAELSISLMLQKISEEKNKTTKTLNMPFKSFFEVRFAIMGLKHPFNKSRQLDYLVTTSTTKDSKLALEGYLGSRMSNFVDDILVSDWSNKNSVESNLKIKKSQLYLMNTYFQTKSRLVLDSKELLRQDPKSFDGMRYLKLVNQLNALEKVKFGEDFTEEKIMSFTRQQRYEFIQEIVNKLLVFDNKMRMNTPILLRDRDLVNIDRLTNLANPNIIVALKGESYFQTMKNDFLNTTRAAKAQIVTQFGVRLPEKLMQLRQERKDKLSFNRQRGNEKINEISSKLKINNSLPSAFAGLDDLISKKIVMPERIIDKNKGKDIVIVYSSEPIIADGEALPYERKQEGKDKFIVAPVKVADFKLENLGEGSYECLSNTFGGYQKKGFIQIYNDKIDKKIEFQNSDRQPHNVYGPAITYTNPNKISEFWLNGNKLANENQWKSERDKLYPEYNIGSVDFDSINKTPQLNEEQENQMMKAYG
jgi:hypothetical protein